ncbi:MAG: pyridoxamine 5'-phosphate oxidase family protein [Dehalococcoidia bacterium]|nr:pyridoxamine 5'-phosphate oxidase family protein [Dehalococcoidia bacterium]
MYHFSDNVLEYLRSGIAVQTATVSPGGRPQAANAWGPRCNENGTMTLFLDTAAAGQTLANLAVNGKIAVITADPVSYRSIQFKGKWLSASQPTDEEREWVKRHRELFTTAMALVGDDPEAIRNRWLDEVTRVDFEVEAAFDQTPGPNAGLPL